MTPKPINLRVQCRRYGLALAAFAAAFLVRFSVQPILGNRIIFMQFLIAAFLVGRGLGFGPSVMVLCLGVFGANFFFTYPLLMPDLFDLSYQISMVAYLGLGWIIVWGTRQERKARTALEHEIEERKIAEHDLRTSQKRLALAIRAGKLGTFEIDISTARVRRSELGNVMHGDPPDRQEVTLEEAIDTLHPDDRAAAWDRTRNRLSGSASTKGLYRVVWPQGETRWIEVYGELSPDDCQMPTHFVGVCSDVTDRVQSELLIREAEQRFRHLATHAPVGIFQGDLEGRCLFVNDRWCEMAGISAEQAAGDGWRAAIHPDDQLQVFKDWNDAVRANLDYAGDCRLMKPNGEVVWIQASASTLRDADGVPTSYIGTVVDVTERRQAIASLEAEQNLLRQSIELQDRERELIAYDIHDGLIQYATGALMHLEGLRARFGESEAEQFEPTLKALRQTVAEGRRVMNGIRTPVLDQHGVVAAIEELVAEKRASNTKIEFVTSPDKLGRLTPGWETAIYRMVQEALTNAIKHSQSSEVRITLEHTDHQVYLEIRDWGVGMPPKESSRGVHGLGGIKQRVRLLSGTFKLESSPGNGTQIKIELPLGPK